MILHLYLLVSIHEKSFLFLFFFSHSNLLFVFFQPCKKFTLILTDDVGETTISLKL